MHLRCVLSRKQQDQVKKQAASDREDDLINIHGVLEMVEISLK